MQMIFQSGNNKSAQVGQQNNENEPHEIGTVLVFFLKEKGEKIKHAKESYSKKFQQIVNK